MFFMLLARRAVVLALCLGAFALSSLTCVDSTSVQDDPILEPSVDITHNHLHEKLVTCYGVPKKASMVDSITVQGHILCDEPTVITVSHGRHIVIKSDTDLIFRNLFFVVERGSRLDLLAERGIFFERDEVNTMFPFFYAYGKVHLHAAGWIVMHVHGTPKDKNDAVIVQDDGVVSSTADIKYTENTMAISTVTPHIEREIEAMIKAWGPPPTSFDIAMPTVHVRPEDRTDDSPIDLTLQTCPFELVPAFDDPWARKFRSPLTVGEVLDADMPLTSSDGFSHITLAEEGSVMFHDAKMVASAGDSAFTMNEGDSLRGGVALIDPSMRKLRRVTRIREAVHKEDEENKEGVPLERKKGIPGMWRAFRTRGHDRARRHAGEVNMTINDRGRIDVNVDGVSVISRSGKHPWELLNRLRWPRKKDDGYEAHVTRDGMEVRLGDRRVWGIAIDDDGHRK